MKIYLEVYGCAASQSDSEIMAGILSKNHEIIDSIEKADIILITTCDVKAVTEQKITDHAIRLTKQFPEKKLILAGCMADNRAEKLRKLLPNTTLVSTHRITEIEKAIQGARIELLNKTPTSKICLPRIRKDKEIGIVQISEGCRGNCTFCSTRLAKGPIHSYPIDAIIEDINSLVADGCKKIYLTSQDTGAYGYDLKGKCLLPDLLSRVSEIEGSFSVRVGMMNPDNVLETLPELIKSFQSEKIMKFLHLPVQSGSDSILQSMNRRYSIAQFKQIIQEFRKSYPSIVIGTDIIVGYPDETEEQFQATLSLLREIKPDYTNISRFAKREGTISANLKQFPTDEMKKRTKICSELVQELKSL